ncbi:aqualysin-1-like [Diadema setosum]|uniref:aqualysin-1-like n=1 Tax=Diadema setosum TaxID=31175 RepID=UPI003B3A2119
MKIFIVVAFIVTVVASVVADRELAPLRRNPDKFNDRHIIVLENDIDVDAFASRFDTDSGLTGRTTVVWKLRTAVKAVVADLDPDTVDKVRSLPGVRFVEEDRMGYVDWEVGSSASGDENWGTDRINERERVLDGDRTMPTGEGANIFIIDTGIRVTHTEFDNGRAIWAKNFADEVIKDCYGHGTHCAGIAAGARYGVAKKATVYAVKVCDCRGACPGSSVTAGVDYVASLRKDGMENVVASLSLSVSSDALKEAVKAAIAEGVVVLTSAGNDGFNACHLIPGNIPEVITVGNVQKDDSIRRSSNYGQCVDIIAPGTDIVSASHEDDISATTMTGTSMACPHVAGAAGILMARYGVHPNDVSEALVSQATKDVVTGMDGSLRSGTPNELLYLVPEL